MRSLWAYALGLCVLAPSLVALICQAPPAGCSNCTAFLIMPDTQHYASVHIEAARGDHFSLLMRWACANRKWLDPDTGGTMPLAAVIGLGDVVHSWDRADNYAAADAAYDVLDACGLPYLGTLGNHEFGGFETSPATGPPITAAYQEAAVEWDTWFGPSRYASSLCTEAAGDCTGDGGKWYIGPVAGSDMLVEDSRNNRHTDAPESRSAGPDCSSGGCEGRHRVMIVRGAEDRPFLLLAADMDADFATDCNAGNGDLCDGGDDLNNPTIALLQDEIDDYPGLFTILVSHAAVGIDGNRGRANFDGDDPIANTPFIGVGGVLWEQIVDPNPQVFAMLGGHYLTKTQAQTTPQNASGDEVLLAFRNYQNASGGVGSGYGNGSDPACPSEGNGWIDMLIVDPERDEIRMRSYRIDDTDADLTYDGTPEATENLDRDFCGEAAVTIAMPIGDTRPIGEDNCPDDYNPDQRDSDDDGTGDACDAS